MEDKFIIKENNLPGVDKSISDLSMLSTVSIAWTEVTQTMFKKGRAAFIGLKENLNSGDVIRVGKIKKLYKIVQLKSITKDEIRLYQIVRVDNNPVVSTDINNIEVGQKVQVVNRKTFEQQMSHIFDKYDEVPVPTTVDACDQEICPAPLPSDYALLPYTYREYTYSRNFGDPAQTITYVGKEGTQEEIAVPACNFRGCEGIVFCAARGTIKIGPDHVKADNEECPEGLSCVNIVELEYTADC